MSKPKAATKRAGLYESQVLIGINVLRFRSVWTAVVLILSAVAAGCHRPVEPLIPSDPSLVSRMEAELDTRERAIDRFDIRAEDFGTVLKLFESGTVDPNPLPWVFAGTVRITYTDGRSSSVPLFLTFQTTGAYRIGGKYYRGTTDEAIIRTIVECHERAKTNSAP